MEEGGGNKRGAKRLEFPLRQLSSQVPARGRGSGSDTNTRTCAPPPPRARAPRLRRRRRARARCSLPPRRSLCSDRRVYRFPHCSTPTRTWRRCRRPVGSGGRSGRGGGAGERPEPRKSSGGDVAGPGPLRKSGAATGRPVRRRQERPRRSSRTRHGLRHVFAEQVQ